MSLVRLILAFLAIVSVATVPAGFMPARAKDGSFYLMICPGVQSRIIASAVGEMPAGSSDHLLHISTLDGEFETGSSPDHSEHESAGFDMRCDYASASVAPVPDIPEVNILVSPGILILQDKRQFLTGIYPSGLPPATGPPAF